MIFAKKEQDPRLSIPPTQRDVVCVLGGRSGTSLVARLVNILGVYLGRDKHMMAANKANERGFWEHTQIVALNDEILGRYGAKWPKLVPMPDGWENDPKLDDLREKAVALIEKEFTDSPLWGWKDPRACATLPFWQKLMPNMRYVLCFRNPIDTARSNAESLKSVVKESAWNWLEQMQDKLYLAGVANWVEFAHFMLKHTNGKPRMTLLYEDVMADTEAELRRIARFIGNPEAGTDPKVLKAMREFKSDKLRHHNTTLDDVLNAEELPLVAKSVFLSLRARVTLEEEAHRAAERGEADRNLAEAMPLDAVSKLTDAAMKQRAAKEQNAPAQSAPATPPGMAALAAMGFKGAGGMGAMAGMGAMGLGPGAMGMAAGMGVGMGALGMQGDAIQQAVAARAVAAEEESKKAEQQAAAKQALNDHIRRIVVEHTPADAQVIVVSHGDEDLLKSTGRPSAHFPQNEQGEYLGYHPADSATAIAALRSALARGATFLAIPKPQMWWLDHYAELREHLDTRHRKVCGDEQCVLYQLIIVET